MVLPPLELFSLRRELPLLPGGSFRFGPVFECGPGNLYLSLGAAASRAWLCTKNRSARENDQQECTSGAEAQLWIIGASICQGSSPDPPRHLHEESDAVRRCRGEPFGGLAPSNALHPIQTLPNLTATIQSEEQLAEVAQLVEQLIRNQQVVGSTPIFGSIPFFPANRKIARQTTSFAVRAFSSNLPSQSKGVRSQRTKVADATPQRYTGAKLEKRFQVQPKEFK